MGGGLVNTVFDGIPTGSKCNAPEPAYSFTTLALMTSLALGGLIGIALTFLVHEASELLAVINGLRAGGLRAGMSSKRAYLEAKTIIRK